MRMEVAGICGTDVKLYKTPPSMPPLSWPREHRPPSQRRARVHPAQGLQGRRPGVRRALRHVRQVRVVPPRPVRRLRKYRLAHQTPRHPLRLYVGREGSSSVGGFAQYVYLPWNAVVHRVPKGVTPDWRDWSPPWRTASNGRSSDGGVAYDSTVLIRGPANKDLPDSRLQQAGASLIIVTGTSKDVARMKVAKELGAAT